MISKYLSACLFIVISLLINIVAYAKAPATVATDAQVRAILEARIQQKAAKGLAVGLLYPDGADHIVTAGATGNPARAEIDGDTLFEIGSITKTFTTTLLAQMVERGDLSLDDKVRQYAPVGLAMNTPGAGDITLRQLATHTAGLPRIPIEWAFIKSAMLDWKNPYANYSTQQMWAYGATMQHDPTKQYEYSYSNYGVGLLGAVLSSRAGKHYEALVQQCLTGPLGMSNTHISIPAEKQVQRAFGHDTNLRRTAFWDLPGLAGAGALRSSVKDMAVWLKAQRDGTLPGARLSQTPQHKIVTNLSIGLGWHISNWQDEQIIWHNGGTGGFRSFTGFSTKSGMGVVVLSNAAIGVDDIGMHLINPAFKLTNQPPIEYIANIVFSGILIIVILTGLLRASIVVKHSMQRPAPTVKAGRWRRWFGPRQIDSKFDISWLLFESALIGWFIVSLTPWVWLGIGLQYALCALYVLTIAMLIYLIKLSRPLPWRIQRKPGFWEIIVRISSVLIMLFLIFRA